jgi:hypothetical protein
MPATMQSVTTRGYGISGGFAGDIGLVVTLGYGFGEGVVFNPVARICTPGMDRTRITAAGTDRTRITAAGTIEDC